ncbi:MAG: class I SAM-dependent methyltransferase [Candidatus Omnitrophica bacterium]|nr:class I SAM-dependent methyltransferase [Candidatus Omnitrophota bacterium]MBI2495417.1 class I SAM-dependent methyltransferase [Candidatus Omnitrophota bacterium]MBI3021897.1 class I SAM-dependent methyltransferase [Candidatus Omnitrophota bacterium]
MSVETGQRTTCRVCDARALIPAIDLGSQPWCNHFLRPDEIGREPFYPLRVVYCERCRTAQLDYTIPKEVMFGDHTYLTGVTRTLSEHFRRVAEEVDTRFFQDAPAKSVLDIGSNDGTQLQCFQALGYNVLGIESAKTPARIAAEKGVETVQAFFNRDVVRRIGRRFHVVTAAGVFFHLEELHSATDGIREALRDDGVFAIQFLYMKSIVEEGSFDQIYHEHLVYYTLESLEGLLSRHGLALFDAYVAPIHGGSVIAFATHQGRRQPTPRLQELRRKECEGRANALETYQGFAQRIGRMKEGDLVILRRTKEAGRRIYGLGAPAKGNTRLNHFAIGPDVISCLVERNPLRKGLYSPGTHIPIALEEDLKQPPDVYYVLAWNFREEILARHREDVARGVEFCFPTRLRQG